jgi:hypothetical protein
VSPKWVATAVAWAAYAASWFLPTLKFEHSGLFSDLDAGWKAFTIVLSIVMKPESIDFVWFLSTASVLSNLAVVLSPLKFRRSPVPVWFTAVLAIAFVVNLTWFILITDSTLQAGYWLWVGSMGALALVGAGSLLRASRPGSH